MTQTGYCPETMEQHGMCTFRQCTVISTFYTGNLRYCHTVQKESFMSNCHHCQTEIVSHNLQLFSPFGVDSSSTVTV